MRSTLSIAVLALLALASCRTAPVDGKAGVGGRTKAHVGWDRGPFVDLGAGVDVNLPDVGSGDLAAPPGAVFPPPAAPVAPAAPAPAAPAAPLSSADLNLEASEQYEPQPVAVVSTSTAVPWVAVGIVALALAGLFLAFRRRTA